MRQQPGFRTVGVPLLSGKVSGEGDGVRSERAGRCAVFSWKCDVSHDQAAGKPGVLFRADHAAFAENVRNYKDYNESLGIMNRFDADSRLIFMLGEINSNNE